MHCLPLRSQNIWLEKNKKNKKSWKHAKKQNIEVDVNPNPHFMLDSVFYTVLVWVAHAAP